MRYRCGSACQAVWSEYSQRDSVHQINSATIALLALPPRCQHSRHAAHWLSSCTTDATHKVFTPEETGVQHLSVLDA